MDLNNVMDVGKVQVSIFWRTKYKHDSMSGKNRRLITYEPVEFET